MEEKIIKTLRLTIDMNVNTTTDCGCQKSIEEIKSGIRLREDDVVDGFVVTMDIKGCNNTVDFFIKDYALKNVVVADTDGKTYLANSENFFVPISVLDEIKRQDNIDWGKMILGNYSHIISKGFDNITEEEFCEYAEKLNDRMLSNNGEMEYDTLAEMFELADA